MLNLDVGYGRIEASVFLCFEPLWIVVCLLIYISLWYNQNCGHKLPEIEGLSLSLWPCP